MPPIPFLGTEALAAAKVNRYQLAKSYDPVFRNVYVPKGHRITAAEKAYAAWLWSMRQATVADVSAAALSGVRWIDPWLPAELIHSSRHASNSIRIHSDVLRPDEVRIIRGVSVTTPARTAFDIGRREELDTAVIFIDALMNTTKMKVPAIEAVLEGHRGARGLVRLREVLQFVDGGAESPQETRTCLLLVRAGLPRLTTQIEVWDGRYLIARVDVGWERWKVGVDYDGIHHWQDKKQRTRDIDRSSDLSDAGWRHVRVNDDLLENRPRSIVQRATAALRAAGCPL